MLSVVVIAHESQLKNLPEVLTALKNNQDFCSGVLVFETHNTTVFHTAVELVYKHGPIKLDVIQAQHDFVGFSAGANRDLGVQYIIKKHGPSDFLFIDGDCIPSPNLIQHHSSILSLGGSVVTCGFRTHRTSLRDDGTYSIHGDRRIAHPLTKGRLFQSGMDRAMLHYLDILSHNVCWSCNLGVNYKALQHIQEANRFFVPDTERLFTSVFDGQWGGEDTALGLAAFRTSCAVVMLDPNRSHVEHIFHTTKHQTNANLRKCSFIDRQLQANVRKTTELLVNKEPVETIASNVSTDTLDFYNNVYQIKNIDVWAARACELFGFDTRKTVLAYNWLARNPDIKYIPSASTDSNNTTKQEILDLYNYVRTTPLDVKKFLC